MQTRRAHEKAGCFTCHGDKPPAFEGTAEECVDCHRSDFVRVKFPEHAKFSTSCDDCHSTTAWKPTLEGADSVKPPEPKPEPEQPVIVRPLPKPKPTTSPPPDTITGPSGR